MRIKNDELEVCVDCIQLIANGETGEGPDGETAEEWAAEIAQRQVYKWGSDARHLVPSGDSEPWFSWLDCDGCGSTLGGDRVYAAILTEDGAE